MSWMLTGKGLNYVQISPKDENWFVSVMAKMQESEKEATLREYADSLYEDLSDQEKPVRK